MRSARFAFSWAWFAFSVFYLVNATRIPRGTAEMPGPGVFPVVAGIGLTALSLFIAVRTSFSGERGHSPFPRGADLRRVFGTFGSLAFYVVALPHLGHPLSSGIFFGATLRVMGMRSRKKVAIGGSLAALLSWYLFRVVLEVPLPLAPLVGL